MADRRWCSRCKGFMWQDHDEGRPWCCGGHFITEDDRLQSASGPPHLGDSERQ